MTTVVNWLSPAVGAGGAALAIAVQPALLVPILVTEAALGGLPLLLIAVRTLVAVGARVPVEDVPVS